VPDAAACYCLLGKLWAAYGDTKKAIEYYVESLKLNSFMWDAFTGLCDIGAVVRPQNVFTITPAMVESISQTTQNGHTAQSAPTQDSLEGNNPFVSKVDDDPFNPPPRQRGDGGLSMGGTTLLSKLNGRHAPSNTRNINVETPVANGQDPDDDEIMMGEGGGPVMTERGPAEILHAPGRKIRMQPFAAVEDPPRMRPITSRVRTKTNPSDGEQTDIPRPVNQNGHKRTVSGHSTHQLPTQASQQHAVDLTAAPPRRSARLFNSITSSIATARTTSRPTAAAPGRDLETRERRELRKVRATGTKGRTGTSSTVGRVVSGNRKPTLEATETLEPKPRPLSAAAIAPPPPRLAPQADPARVEEALRWLLDLLHRIGSGYRYLSRYETTKALEAFTSIPTAQRDTPWVLAHIGKAHYERTQYAEAEKVFKKIREKTPSYLEHMEVYSNTLWQLKDDVALGHLAHTLMDQDRLSPQAWCALGNASSLERQHDDAVKCFSRATQLDPKFAYAFTLQGHEHVANEEFDKAMQAYRRAISADNRHYNGWYGLGNVYERMGKYDVAEKHYKAAAQINPNNVTLVVRIGLVRLPPPKKKHPHHHNTRTYTYWVKQVLDRQRRPDAALTAFHSAVTLDPSSIMARFRRAQTLLKLGDTAASLKDLLLLKDRAPDDANIHFLLGRCYKRIGERAMAVKHLTVAMNLDPKSHGVVKEVLESLEGGDEGWSSEEER
jgi:anaphase-promoting complex subunit 3